jgi:hypothetical protein
VSEPDFTLDELRARMRVAGIAIAEARLGMVRKLLADALHALRAFDARAMRTTEPAVRFTPEPLPAPGDRRPPRP